MTTTTPTPIPVDPRDFSALTLLAAIGHAYINGRTGVAASLVRQLDRLNVTDACMARFADLADTQHRTAMIQMVKELKNE